MESERVTANTPERCPACGSTDVVEIVYGMPTHDTVLEAEAGTIALGGCVIEAWYPTKHCNRCATRFAISSDEEA